MSSACWRCHPARAGLLAALLLAAPVWGGQHLVGPGDTWQQLQSRVRPGDEIILMPGRHRWASLAGLAGAADRPIVIRGLSQEKPATIAAEHEGLRLTGVRHLIIRDLTISGATINGITLSAPDDHAGEEPWRADLRVENVTIKATGPEGRRHAIQIAGCAGVTIKECDFEGWGGAAIDVLRSADVTISHCSFTGTPTFSQRSAVHVRGASRDVRVTDCSVSGTIAIGIAVGGEGDPPLADLTRPTSADPKPAAGPLATGVRIVRCIIRDCACPIVFYSAHDSSVRNVTIVRPRQFVLAVDLGPASPTLVPSRGLVFESNLVRWEAGDLRRLGQTGARFDPAGLTIAKNLWWSPEAPEARTALGPLPAPPSVGQVEDIDPQLDEEQRPHAPKAELFGAFSP